MTAHDPGLQPHHAAPAASRRGRGRRHSDHRSRRHRGQLEEAREHDRAGRVRRRGQGRRLWLRPRAGRRRSSSKAGCKTFFVADLDRRPARARDRARRRSSTCSTASCPAPAPALAEAQSAAGDQQPDRACRMGQLRRHQQLARRRGAARRHRHEPARPHASTRRSRSRRALQSENHGFTLLMSHLACADTPDHPLNDKQIRLFREIRITVSRHPVLARQFLRHLPRRHRPLRPGAARASRSTASIRRPARQIRCGRWSSSRAASSRCAHVKKGDTVGYGATLTAARPSRIAIVAVGYADGYLRAAGAAKGKPAARGDHRRQALPARRPRLHGSDRRRRHRSARRQRRAAATSPR